MKNDGATGGSTLQAPGAWAPGVVARMLGVSPVTLRSWDSRYGIGPSIRGDGKHRRYSDFDVRRLQHMQRLIDRGMRAREAAATVLSGAALSGAVLSGAASPEAGPVVSRGVQELTEAAEELRSTAVAALLDDSLSSIGVVATWADMVVPVLQSLGDRWVRGDVCFAAEWTLTSEISLAFERYSHRFEGGTAGRPVLLACCPGERHSLPMAALRAALVEAGAPVVFLGQMVPAETMADLASKLDPALVMLWSMTANTADDRLAQRLADGGFRVRPAGPGWEHLAERGIDEVNDLATALRIATDIAAVR